MLGLRGEEYACDDWSALAGTELGGGRSARCLSLRCCCCACGGVMREVEVEVCVIVLAGEAVVLCALRTSLVLGVEAEDAASELEPSVLSVRCIRSSRVERRRLGVM